MLCKEFFFFARFAIFQQSRTDWAFCQKALYETFVGTYFEFGPVVQEKMSFKYMSYLQLWQPSYVTKQNNLGNFGRGHYEINFCEIILHLDQWFRRGDISYLELWWASCSAEQNR